MSTPAGGCTTEELAHTSEIGLRARARTLGELFACLGRAMIALTGAQADARAEVMTLEVDAGATDVESLLVNWLNEMLYLHEVTGIVPQEVTVQAITPQSIQTLVAGRKASEPAELQIKAVTYHQLSVIQEAGEWKAEVFFDI